MKNYKIFLDDIRVPTDIYPQTNNNDWIVIRNLADFKNTIKTQGIPSFISFDNDLGASLEEGKDAVKWLVFDKEADIRNMNYKVHSANTSGVRDYIIGTLNNWKKHLNQDDSKELNEYLDSDYSTEIATRLSKKLNLSSPKFIDCGSNGCAFMLTDNVVLKITPSRTEAAQSKKIINQKNKHISDIYGVYSISGEEQPLYAILSEFLRSDSKIKKGDYCLSAFFRQESIALTSYSFFYDYATNVIKEDMFKDVEEFMVNCKEQDAVWYFHQMKGLIDELRKKSIESYDFVTVNLGLKKDGSLGYFDLGFGDSSGNEHGEEISLDEKQKVISDTKVLFHGTNNSDDFKFNKKLFFSDSKEFAKDYGKFLYKCNVNLGKIFDSTKKEFINILYESGIELKDDWVYSNINDREDYPNYDFENNCYQTVDDFMNGTNGDTWEAIETTPGALNTIWKSGFDSILIIEGGEVNYLTDSSNVVEHKLINRTVTEVRAKVRSTILEYMQAAQKVYFNTGKLDDKDKEDILSITNGDNYTKIISDIYYALKNARYKGDFNIDMLKPYYKQLKLYDKNVFPVKGLNIAGVKNINEIINCLNRREKILEEIKKLPSIAIRNLKNDIRTERNSKELQNYSYDLENFIRHISMLSNRDEKMRDAVFRKMFKSNTTMKDLSNFVEERQNLLGGYSFSKNKVKEIVNEYGSESEIVYEKGNIMVAEINGSRGIAKIGCNSLWCFSYGKGNNWSDFNSYSTNGVVYVIIDFSQKPDSIDFMHVLIKPINWDYEYDENNNNSYSPLYSMDNEPVENPNWFIEHCVGSEENAKKIFNFGLTVVDKKEIFSNVESIFDNYYARSENPLPTFEEFYEKYLEHFPEKEQEDRYNDEVKKIAKEDFKKLTINPNQMSLFEMMLRKRIKTLIFEKNIMIENFDFNEDGELLPSNLIDTFIKRINKLFSLGADINHPQVKKEIERATSANGGNTPKRILELVK